MSFANFRHHLAWVCLCSFVTLAQAQVWTDISANVPGAVTTGNIGPMATDGTRLYVLGQTGVFVSEDGGATFTAINTVQGAGYSLGQYGHRFVGVANGLVWVGTDPGSAALNDGLATLHRLTPGQTTWQKSSTGFPVGTTGNQADDIAYDASTGKYYAIGAIGGVFVSSDGVSWESRNNGNGGLGLPATVEAFNGTAFAVRPLGGVNRSVDQGLNWTPTGGIPGPGSGTLLRLGNRLLIATVGNNTLQDGLYYSDDLGVTWSFTQQIPNQYDLTTDGTLGYAAGNGGSGPVLYFTGTGGTTWDTLSTAGITNAINRVVRVGGQFFVTGQGRLYRGDAASLNLLPTTVITRQPVGGGVNEGGNFTFSVEAVGAGPFTYVWKRDGSPIGGAPNSATYPITGATSAAAGAYTVEVTGGRGTATSTAVNLYYSPATAGTLDYAFRPATPQLVSSVVFPIFTTNISGTIYAAAQESGGGVAFGGAGFNAVQSNYRVRLAKVDPTGRLDPSFVTGTGLNIGSGPTVEVFAVLPLANGELLVGGGTDTGGGQLWRRYRADGSVDAGWPAPVELSSSIYKAALLTDGKILVAGRFPGGLLRLNANGTVDRSFVGTSTLGTVRDFAVQPDGKIVVVGEFTAPVNRVARLNANGSLDNTFTVGTGANATVYAVALQSDGAVVIAGNFTTFNGTGRTRVARLTSNGALDSGFNPGTGPNATVRDLTIAADGSVYVGGSFSLVADTARARFARLTPTGALDPAYPDAQLDNNVFSLNLQPDGHVLVGGQFTTVGGAPAAGLVRLFGQPVPLAIVGHPTTQRADAGGTATFRVAATGTTAITYQWRRNLMNLSDGAGISGASGPVLTLTGVTLGQEDSYDVVVSNGSGNLTSSPAALLVNAAPVVEAHPLGGTAGRGNTYTFNVAARGLDPLTYQWRKDNTDIPGATNASFTLGPTVGTDAAAYTVRVQNGSGSATSDPAVLVVSELPGSVENIFRLSGTGPNATEMADVADAGGGKVYVAGYFSSWNGDNTKDGIVRLNADGSLDTGFGNNGNTVDRLVVQPDGKVIVSGGIGFKRLNSNGSVDSSFVPPIDGDNSALLLQPDGKVIVGRSFTSANGDPYEMILRLNVNGSVDNTFYVGSGFSIGSFDNLRSLALMPDGKLIVGGQFTSYQGSNAPPVIRLNANGVRDAVFNPTTLVNGTVEGVAVQSDGRVIVVGNTITRLNQDGSVDPSFQSSNQFNGLIRHALVLPDGKIAVAGDFTAYTNSQPGTVVNGMARLNANGSLDSNFAANQGLGARQNTRVNRLALLGDGKLAAAGTFKDFSEQPRWYVTKVLNEQPALAFLAQPASSTPAVGSTLRLSVSATGTNAISYQWRKQGTNLVNGGSISGATTATLVITGVAAGDAGSYDVVISNGAGSQTSAAVSLTPMSGPVVVIPPASKNVITTSTLSLSVIAVGNGTLTYQWRKDGTPLVNGGTTNGATTSSLSITNAQTANSGAYEVVITDSVGTVTSAVAQVTVAIQSGSLDAAWVPATINNQIEDLLLLPDGKIVIAGTFTLVGGVARSQVAMLNTNGTLNTNFAATATLTSIVSNSRRLALLPDGRILLSAHNGTAGGVYAYDTNGVRTALFFPSGLTTDMLVEDNTHIIVTGSTSVRRFAFNGTTWLQDATFTGPTFNGITVDRIIRQPDGKYIVGGYFQNVDSIFSPFVARLNANGTRDASFTVSTGHSANIYALALDPQNNVLVAGGMTYIGGVTSVTGVARLSSAGVGDATFKPNVGDMRDLLVQNDGKVILVGRNTSNGIGIYRFNPDGTPDTSFIAGTGIGTTTYIYAAALAQNGDLYIAGSFTTYNGTTRNRIAKLNNDPGQLAGPSPTFAEWKADKGLPVGQDGPGDDPDGDGLANLAEFAFGTHPMQSQSRVLPANRTHSEGGENYPALSFIRRKNLNGANVVVDAFTSIPFGSAAATTQVGQPEDLGDGTERITLRAQTPLRSLQRFYFRTRVQVP